MKDYTTSESNVNTSDTPEGTKPGTGSMEAGKPERDEDTAFAPYLGTFVSLPHYRVNTLMDRAVPVSLRMVRALRPNTYALDMYLWLSRRCYAAQSPVRVSWAQLRAQMNMESRHDRFFREAVGRAVTLLKDRWEGFDADATDVGLVVRAAPSLVPRKYVSTWLYAMRRKRRDLANVLAEETRAGMDAMPSTPQPAAETVPQPDTTGGADDVGWDDGFAPEPEKDAPQKPATPQPQPGSRMEGSTRVGPGTGYGWGSFAQGHPYDAAEADGNQPDAGGARDAGTYAGFGSM